MNTFIMLTRLATGALRAPAGLEELERSVVRHIKAQCPNVHWLGSYAVLGQYDFVDLFTAPDTETAMKVSTLVRSYGPADTTVWPALEREQFRALTCPHGGHHVQIGHDHQSSN